MKPNRDWTESAARQRGAATLVVVMVLFFIVSLMAAYTSRNLIFEQKTSANQFRGTQAFEAAEAGVEWALTMLNGGRVNDASCGDTSPTKSFAQRYLAINTDPTSPQNGEIEHPNRNGNWPTCVFNGTDWTTCACPDNSALSPTRPVAAGVFPAFRIWLASSGPAWTPPTPEDQRVHFPGIVAVQSNGCTSLPVSSADLCLDFAPQGEVGDGLATVRAFLALRTGLNTPPAAAITARLGVTPDATYSTNKLRVANTDASTSGITVNAGGNIVLTHLEPVSVPGTPGEMSVAPADAKLAALVNVAPPTLPPAAPALSAGERMFVANFGMKRQTYKQQSGLRVCASPCTAAAINALLAANPNRIIWVEGDLTVDANIGTALSPVLLVVHGQTLTLDAGGGDIIGFVYVSGGDLSANAELVLPDAARSIRGALVAESGLTTRYVSTPTSATNVLSVTYDATVLNVLRTSYGTYVRVPGGWRDFR